ncbi:MAG: hypothetical protein ACOCYT_01850 [Chloroflexota bacterium]
MATINDKRGQMLEEINAERGYGVFLLAQMDSVPDTLQFMVATTEYDPEADGLRDRSRYLVRAIGVQEHLISVGIFKQAHIHEGEEHPLLYEYNSPPAGLFFRGQPESPDSLILNLFQAYSSVFGPWRQIPRYLSTSQPLYEMFTSGGALIGEMPLPLAEKLVPVLEAQNLETRLVKGEKPKEQPPMKLLLLDESYAVAMDFAVDPLGQA